MNKVVAFDLDGTLSQSDAYLLRAYEGGLEAMGMPMLPKERLMQMIGGTVDDNKEIILPEGSMEKFMEYLHVVDSLAEKYARLYGHTYPGIPEALARLREKGYKIALCSNGAEGYIRFILDVLGIQELFDAIQPNIPGWNKSDLLRKILKDFQTTQGVMVGDRHFDWEAAKDNQVPFIGCLYGLFPNEVEKAEFTISSPEQLPALVESILGPV